ncbi:MAG: 3-dehydroquinate synthase [Calditrichaeota bacterium]|nr:MAG: 3-dehydroquinate synthase [Calditrichota bacterium]
MKPHSVITVQLPQQAYDIHYGPGLLEQAGRLIPEPEKYRQVALITHPRLYRLYGAALMDNLPADEKTVIELPEGETSKSAETLMTLYTRLLEARFERGALIIALGGGVIGDVAGYAAATYLRGVALVQCPTTLLAQVDSSIGGKTGINHPLGKNLIGAFKQPLCVLADTDVLRTLPDAEIRCGMGEVLKYGFIGPAEWPVYLENHLGEALNGDIDVLTRLVGDSARQKARVVEQDEKESGLRMILNFGHTFGHALEAEFAYGGLKHGEAVILGMRCALWYAREEGFMNADDYARGMALLNRVPVAYDARRIDPEKLWQRMLLDKKVKGGAVRLILVDKPGVWRLHPADPQRVKMAFESLRAGI